MSQTILISRPAPATLGASGQQGSVIIVAVIFMALVLLAASGGAQFHLTSARVLTRQEEQSAEYWAARSGAAAVEASLRADIPQAFDRLLLAAKREAGAVRLPAFDKPEILVAASRPVLDPQGQRTPYPIGECTSLLGALDTWAAAQTYLADDYARGLGHTAQVALLRGAYRRYFVNTPGQDEPAYILEYQIDAVAGRAGRLRPSGQLLLGAAQSGCGASATLDLAPDNIIQGEHATLRVTYQNAHTVIINDEDGNLIREERVSPSATPQVLALEVSPIRTTTYTALARNDTGCEARAAPRTLTVRAPPPVVVLFVANPTCISAGQTARLSWQITGADSATVNGAPVNPDSGSLNVTPAVTTTYTLIASNASGSTPAQATVEVSLPPRINLFNAEPNCIVSNGSSVLRWNVADADTVTLNGNPVAASGSWPVTPATATTYTLEARGGGCRTQTVTAQATVNIAATPRISSFSITPGQVQPGDSATLTWQIADAVSATINGTPVNAVSGSMTVNPLTATTYNLIAAGGGCQPQTAQAQVSLAVGSPAGCPTVDSFTAAPGCIPAGGHSLLQWSVSDADSVRINGNPAPLSGAFDVTPANTTTYTLVAGRAGCPNAIATARVLVGDAQPVINSFTASANTVMAGGSLTLNWDTSNATALTLDGNPVAPNAAGSLTLHPTATHTYTLSATNSACATPQTVSAQVTVTVADCPAIDFFTASPAEVIAGRSAILSWATRNSSGVFLDGLPVASSGSQSVTPDNATTYRLTARSASGLCDIEQLAGVTVTPCPAPVINSFNANPLSITPGSTQPLRLAWDLNDTSGTGLTVTISPGVGSFQAAAGFVEITPPLTATTYTLTVTNGCGASATAQLTVTLAAPPVSFPELQCGWQKLIPPRFIPGGIGIPLISPSSAARGTISVAASGLATGKFRVAFTQGFLADGQLIPPAEIVINGPYRIYDADNRLAAQGSFAHTCPAAAQPNPPASPFSCATEVVWQANPLMPAPTSLPVRVEVELTAQSAPQPPILAGFFASMSNDPASAEFTPCAYHCPVVNADVLLPSGESLAVRLERAGSNSYNYYVEGLEARITDATGFVLQAPTIASPGVLGSLTVTQELTPGAATLELLQHGTVISSSQITVNACP